MSVSDGKNEQILEKHIVPYEKRLVAFLDLQGFKDDIIRNYPAEAIGSVFGKFDCLKKMLESNDLQVTIISDSIVISTTLDMPENLMYFFNTCSFFAKPRIGTLFIAVRGGIAYGDLHHKDNIVFGPALVDAYDISEGSQKSPLLHLRMSSEVFHFIKNLPKFGDFSMAVLFPEDEEKKYYTFNPWLFHLAVASIEETLVEPEPYHDIILHLKEYVAWCVMNIARYRDVSLSIFEKYDDLLVQALCTFKIIKDTYYRMLPDCLQKIIDFYSNPEQALVFAHQLEHDLKEKHIV